MAMIPYASTPGSSANKSKLAGEMVTASDVKQHRCNFDISIEKKRVDGKDVVCYRVNNYNQPFNQAQPLHEEYTDGVKFANDIKEAILSAGDKL